MKSIQNNSIFSIILYVAYASINVRVCPLMFILGLLMIGSALGIHEFLTTPDILNSIATAFREDLFGNLVLIFGLSLGVGFIVAFLFNADWDEIKKRLKGKR